jgi:hypothetical protein
LSRHVLVSLTNALPGAEPEFERWYAAHIREVVDVPGVSPPERWKVAEEQADGMAAPTHTYLTTYGLDGDPGEIVSEIRRRRMTGEWVPREGIDPDTIKMWVFDRMPDPDVG